MIKWASVGPGTYTLASIFALRALTLRPIVHNHPPQFQPQFNPTLHLHATIPAGDDFGDEPDNTRSSADPPLQHRPR
ncbi:hypothetical protein ACH4E5_02320 [Streptomyces afghaniensis]|uniref:hypothetical protein n=1 Tax=Streptomyces afghaniensis TaxID=66865 RepID=UPI00378B3FAF